MQTSTHHTKTHTHTPFSTTLALNNTTSLLFPASNHNHWLDILPNLTCVQNPVDLQLTPGAPLLHPRSPFPGGSPPPRVLFQEETPPPISPLSLILAPSPRRPPQCLPWVFPSSPRDPCPPNLLPCPLTVNSLHPPPPPPFLLCVDLSISRQAFLHGGGPW